jgi:hypothetical protein
MNLSPFSDRRTTKLLGRVRDDVSSLRHDIGDLLVHTTRKTLPNGARELADQARNQLAAGGAYAATRMRSLRPPQTSTQGWVGGAMVVGLLAVGIYALCRNGCQDLENAIAPPDDFPGI